MRFHLNERTISLNCASFVEHRIGFVANICIVLFNCLVQTTDIRVLIDNASVGGLIGKSGGNIKRVRDESGAFVSILKTDYRHVQDRVMVIKGTTAQIANAAKLITEL